jgi:hypothetical protein
MLYFFFVDEVDHRRYCVGYSWYHHRRRGDYVQEQINTLTLVAHTLLTHTCPFCNALQLIICSFEIDFFLPPNPPPPK